MSNFGYATWSSSKVRTLKAIKLALATLQNFPLMLQLAIEQIDIIDSGDLHIVAIDFNSYKRTRRHKVMNTWSYSLSRLEIKY